MSVYPSSLEQGELFQRAQKQAASGKPTYLICNAYGRPLRIESHLTNGLGRIYQIDRDGTVSRVWF